MTQAVCPVLIGRDRERQRLVSDVTAAGRGQGSLVFLSGEAGVGKSRLAAEVGDVALAEGFAVVAGRAVDAATPVPFRPLSEALFSAFRSAGPPRVSALRPLWGALGRLVPEWRDDALASADASLVVVGEAMLRLLRVLAKGRGCLLLLEDLHWADPETLAVVEYLADNLSSEPVLCLCTLRSEESSPARSLAQSLDARRSAVLLELGHLNPADTERMAAACLGAVSLPAELVEPVANWTDGLPFLVEELLAAWMESGAVTSQPDGWTVRLPVGPSVPATFAESIGRRLTVLGPEGRRVLAAAAVLGRHFEWSLLAPITGLDSPTVMAELRRCLGAQLIVEVRVDVGGGFSFRHALTRDAVLAHLLGPERVELAGTALRAIERAHPTLPGKWSDLAADLAEGSLDFDRAGRLLLVAGRRRLAQGALATAEATLERARRLVADDVALTTSVDELLTQVLSLAGKMELALEAGERLLASLRRQSATSERQAEVHLLVARGLLVSGRWASAGAQLDVARDLVASVPATALVAHIDALAAHIALGEARIDDAAALATSALRAAESANLPEVACEALEVLGRRARLSDLAEAEAVFERARDLADKHGLAVWRIRSMHELASIDVVTTRRLDRLNETRDVADQAGALSIVAVVDLQLATVFAFRFEVDEGLHAARRCAEAARRFHLGGLLLPMAQVRQALLPMALLRQAQCHAIAENASDMEACIGEALGLAAGDPEVSAGAWGQCRAMLSLLRENRASAMRELASADGFLHGRPEAQLWVFRGLWILLSAVEDPAGQANTDAAMPGLATLPHHRAFLGYAEAVRLGRGTRPEEAAAAFAAARSAMADAGGGYGAGHLALRLVAEAALSDGWGDPVTWLREAEAFFERTGHLRVAAACRSFLADAGAPMRRRPRDQAEMPAGLSSLGVSRREQEVLDLVVERLTNQEIAARLYLSPRTVAKHVQHLLAKTGHRDRSGLRDWAAQLRP